VAQALLGLGLYGLGDSARAAAAQLSQAANLGAPAPPVLVLLGATYALGSDDKAAVTAWNQAREGGIDDAAVAGLLIDAYLRQGDVARAAAMATAALDTQPDNLAARHALAATYLATRRHADALALLEVVPDSAATTETRFLVAEALYAAFVRRDATLDTPAARARFTTVARTYVAEAGPHAALVRDWLATMPAAGR
jgi:predicted Zn-dependent protease